MMRDIDRLCAAIVSMIGELLPFATALPLIRDLGECAKTQVETLATDADIFDVWAEFVVAIERMQAFRPAVPENATLSARQRR